jgi:hypothetical protein
MKIRIALLYHLACYISFMVIFLIAIYLERYHFINGNKMFAIIAIVYIAFGIFLRKKVHEQLVDYHEIYATIDNIFYNKLIMILFWPFAYVKLFLKLTINKYL